MPDPTGLNGAYQDEHGLMSGNLPAWCRGCGLPWTSPVAINLDLGSWSDMEISPCPRCGGTGDVSNGYVKMLRLAGRTLSGLTPGDLSDLQATLREAQRAGGVGEAATRLELAQPQLAAVARWLSNQSNRMEVGMWLSALLALIAIFIAQGSSSMSDEDVQRVVSNLIQESTEIETPGRNAPCPCGSTAKWKFCHGSPIDRTADDKGPAPAGP